MNSSPSASRCNYIKSQISPDASSSFHPRPSFHQTFFPAPRWRRGRPPAPPMSARSTLGCREEGARRCLAAEADALVTAPVNKEAIIRSGVPFVGQTEFLSSLAGVERTVMMLLGPDDRGRWLRVALATTHLPLKKVAESLTQAKVELAIELAARACRDLRSE